MSSLISFWNWLEIWDILVGLCVLASLFYPTIKGKICGLIFCAVAFIPEIIPVQGLEYFATCVLCSIFAIMAIQYYEPYSKYSFAISLMLGIQILLCIVGMLLWWPEVSKKISEYVFYNWAYDISPLFIIETLANLYYFIAIIVLIDFRGRKDAIGVGFFQYIGDVYFAPHIRFKDDY